MTNENDGRMNWWILGYETKLVWNLVISTLKEIKSKWTDQFIENLRNAYCTIKLVFENDSEICLVPWANWLKIKREFNFQSNFCILYEIEQAICNQIYDLRFMK